MVTAMAPSQKNGCPWFTFGHSLPASKSSPGYAWTTAEGEAVMNTYVHLCLSSSISTDRDELPPCELSWLVGDLLRSDLKWRSKAGACTAQNPALCCFVL